MFCYCNVKQVAILKGVYSLIHVLVEHLLFRPKFWKFWLEIKIMEWTIPFQFNQNIWDHFWKWSTLTSLVISVGWTKMSVIPFDKIVVPSTALLYPGLSTITKYAVPWLGSVEPKYTVPLGTWNFRNFKTNFSLNGKHPFFPTRKMSWEFHLSCNEATKQTSDMVY